MIPVFVSSLLFWKVTKYIYSSSVLSKCKNVEHNFEVLFFYSTTSPHYHLFDIWS